MISSGRFTSIFTYSCEIREDPVFDIYFFILHHVDYHLYTIYQLSILYMILNVDHGLLPVLTKDR